MKIKSVILDTTRPSVSTLNHSLWQYNNEPLIDWQIKKIQNSGRTAILVIGQDGDEILRQSKEADFCDLVFTSEKTPLYGLVAGLHGSGTCAFYLPVEIPFPTETVWTELEKEYLKLPYNHTVHVIKSESEEYPMLITKLGRDTILKSGHVAIPDLCQKSIAINITRNENSSTKTVS